MADILTAEQQADRMAELDGRGKVKALLAQALFGQPNIVLLDEPTNDLDITTLAILEEYLETFPGAVLAVSHDRYFLDKTAQQIFEVGEGGVITRYTGNYSDYLEKRKANEAPAEKAAKKAPSGKPVRQKKLKFSYKEQKEFDTIEDDIADLEQKIADLDTQMAACGSDYVKLQDLTNEQDAAKAALDEKMERWMYLTDLAEKIAAQEK